MDKKEFESELLKSNVTERFLSMSRAELEEKFGSEFLRTVDFGDQNNSHHQYELFEHILRTVDSVATTELSEEDLVKVRVAAFFHDIGKPNVAQLNEKTGQTQFIGHAKESANIANGILRTLGYSDNEINELNFLIQCHDDFINIAREDDATPERISKIFASITKKLENYHPTISDMRKLIVLCQADAMAQNDVIMKNGQVVDTKASKLARLDAILSVLPEAIVLKQNQEIEKLKKQKDVIQNGPQPIEKKGRIVNQKQIDLWNSKTEEQKQHEMSEIDARIEMLEDEKRVLLEVPSYKEIILSQEATLQSQEAEIADLNGQLDMLKANQK